MPNGAARTSDGAAFCCRRRRLPDAGLADFFGNTRHPSSCGTTHRRLLADWRSTAPNLHPFAMSPSGRPGCTSTCWQGPWFAANRITRYDTPQHAHSQERLRPASLASSRTSGKIAVSHRPTPPRPVTPGQLASDPRSQQQVATSLVPAAAGAVLFMSESRPGLPAAVRYDDARLPYFVKTRLRRRSSGASPRWSPSSELP